MKTLLFVLANLLFLCLGAQEVVFEEYDLANGLHVILHQDNRAPVVTTSVLYHVGAKDESPNRTGFSHFFEHLLFEGTKNIPRGEWFNLVSSNGGTNNAYTTDDFTYYYVVFPSNNLALGLWLESERMLHPVINQIGVDTQNEVVKTEKQSNFDDRPYGYYEDEIKKRLFKKHPYQRSSIGELEHLDAASLDEFLAFNHKYYVPNNAVLVVAGDIDIPMAKKEIQSYFGPISKGDEIERTTIVEAPITAPITATYYDKNIQIPAVFSAYRTPGVKTREAKVLEMISAYLSSGKSSKLYKKMVDERAIALEVDAFTTALEDYGFYIILSLPLEGVSLTELVVAMDEEVSLLQKELISENDFQKIKNKFEAQFVNSNASVEGIAESLAQYYMINGNTNLINTEIELYRSISREEILQVANKYLSKNQRLILNYLPSDSN
ncbi:MAG: M16 family metallopeptidase [Flavobacteriaceae bacterium]